MKIDLLFHYIILLFVKKNNIMCVFYKYIIKITILNIIIILNEL
jgi:hypothetical protein